jgi:hypothetical protein
MVIVSVWGIFPHYFPGMDKKILLKTYFKYVKYILSTAGEYGTLLFLVK